MRPIKVTKNFINSAENSVLYESGNTKVLVTVSVSTRLPDWLLNSDKGWVTAEYNMLPGSSGNRISRKSYESGRSKDCLLYTSPSPRDSVVSRMPSSA